MKKADIVAAARAQIQRDLERTRARAEDTRQAATHEEARPENDKDTRGLEASYLARGQAMRAEELEEADGRLRFLALRDYGPDDPIGLAALITVEGDEDERLYFLSPVSGGLEVELDGQRVQLITPASPVGRALVDKLEGDEIDLRLAGRTRTLTITKLS